MNKLSVINQEQIDEIKSQDIVQKKTLITSTNRSVFFRKIRFVSLKLYDKAKRENSEKRELSRQDAYTELTKKYGLIKCTLIRRPDP